VAADHLRNPRGGPQLSPPAVGFGPLQEQPFELTELVGIQAWRSAGMRLGSELVGGFAVLFQPGVNGGPTAPEEACDCGGMFPLMDESNGTAAPAFEFFCSSDGSHTTTTELHGLLFSLLCWSQ
jgi:hypothetical protein